MSDPIYRAPAPMLDEQLIELLGLDVDDLIEEAFDRASATPATELCGASSAAIDNGAPCKYLAGHLDADIPHTTANGLWWADATPAAHVPDGTGPGPGEGGSA